MQTAPPHTKNGIVDVAIVGGGPTGLFAAFYAGLRQMSIKIIDSLDILGGQLNTLYPEKYIYDVAGFPRILAKELVSSLTEQAMQYGPTVCLGEEVQKLEEEEPGKVWRLITNKHTHLARSIIISGGIGAFQPKMLALPNVEQFRDRGLFYFVKDISLFKGKRVLIVGGGDSAVDWANMLAPIASHLTLIHRRDGFRAHEDSVKKMYMTPAKIKTFFELEAIGGNGKIETAVIFDNRTKERETLHVDAVLVNIGFVSSLGPIKEWGLKIEKGSIVVDYAMQTSRPGIYAAGDIVQYPSKLKLIATGFGEACTAVCNAKHHIDPLAKVFPGHSSEMK